MAGGDKAQLNSKNLVNECKGIITKHGFSEDIILTDGVAYTNIMGLHRIPTCEFRVKPSMSRDVRIICRYLSAEGGSVVDKLPTFMLNAQNIYPQEEIIFIIDGKGYDKSDFGDNPMSPRKYLEREAEKTIGKTIKVWTKEQFDKWVESGMMWLHINTKTYSDFKEEVIREFEFEKDTPENRARIEAETQRRYTNEVLMNR
jgi:hypothetical protein